MDNYYFEEVARHFLAMGIQHWGQTAEQRESATKKFVEAAKKTFGSTEANDWLKGVILTLPRGKFETEVDHLIDALLRAQP